MKDPGVGRRDFLKSAVAGGAGNNPEGRGPVYLGRVVSLDGIDGPYLGAEAGDRFAAARRDRPGVLLQLFPVEPRVWNLGHILPR